MDETAGGNGTSPPRTVPTPTTVRLLGVPSISRGEEQILVPEGCKRLVAFVALRPVRVERSFAAGTLWPDGDDLRAAGNLRSALWRLRRSGVDVVEADKWYMALSPGVAVDVHDVARWASRLIGGSAAPEDLSLGHFTDDVWCLLPGVYDVWVVMERERLRQLLLHALEALTCRLVELRRFPEAVDVALRAVAQSPLRESAQRALISAHLADGNVAEARASFDQFEHDVRVELGVEPSRGIRELIGYQTRTGTRSGTKRG